MIRMATYITEAMRPARVAKGLTIDHVAALIGLAPATVGNVERGQQRIKIEKAVLIANLLDIPFECLVTDKARRPRKDERGESAQAEDGSEPDAEAKQSSAA